MSTTATTNNETLTATLSEMVKVLPEDLKQSVLTRAAELSQEELKKNAEEFKTLSSVELETKTSEIRANAFVKVLMDTLAKNRRSVYWEQPGYWMDKFIQGGVTLSMGVAVAAAAMYLKGRPAETTLETETPISENPFKTHATERPVRAAREIKTA